MRLTNDTSKYSLSKRELFAAMAMQGMLSNSKINTFQRTDIAHQSVMCADALIMKLNNGKEED